MKNTLKLAVIILLAFWLWSCGSKDEKNEIKNEGNTNEKQTEQVQQNTNQQTQQPQQTEQKQTDSLKELTGEAPDANNKQSAPDKTETLKDVKIKAMPDEKKFENDPKGQWPYDVDASSMRANRSDDMDLGYSNIQMVGKPNVKAYGDDKNAWCPLEENKGNEWIRPSFQNPVHATEIRVRQTCGPGTISKVELFDDKGQVHLIWEGKDDNKYEPNKIQYFVISFPKTTYKVKSVRISMATNKVPGWNEIDGIQLIGE